MGEKLAMSQKVKMILNHIIEGYIDVVRELETFEIEEERKDQESCGIHVQEIKRRGNILYQIEDFRAAETYYH